MFRWYVKIILVCIYYAQECAGSANSMRVLAAGEIQVAVRVHVLYTGQVVVTVMVTVVVMVVVMVIVCW